MDLPDMIAHDFGSLLYDLRTRKGWTLEQLAVMAGCSASYIHRVEGCKRTPSLEIKLSLLHGLGLPSEMLAEVVAQLIVRQRAFSRQSM